MHSTCGSDIRLETHERDGGSSPAVKHGGVQGRKAAVAAPVHRSFGARQHTQDIDVPHARGERHRSHVPDALRPVRNISLQHGQVRHVRGSVRTTTLREATQHGAHDSVRPQQDGQMQGAAVPHCETVRSCARSPACRVPTLGAALQEDPDALAVVVPDRNGQRGYSVERALRVKSWVGTCALDTDGVATLRRVPQLQVDAVPLDAMLLAAMRVVHPHGASVLFGKTRIDLVRLQLRWFFCGAKRGAREFDCVSLVCRSMITSCVDFATGRSASCVCVCVCVCVYVRFSNRRRKTKRDGSRDGPKKTGGETGCTMLVGGCQQQRKQAKKLKAKAKKEAQRRRQRAKQNACNELWRAAQRGQIDAVEVFLRNSNELLGSPGSRRLTYALCWSLRIAVMNDHERVVCALLAAGARPSLDITIVCAAARTDNVAVLQHLVDARGDINNNGPAVNTPLFAAAESTSSACVTRLLVLKANLSAGDWIYNTPLFAVMNHIKTSEPAARRKSLCVVRSLLAAKQHPHVHLKAALRARRFDVAHLLLDARALVDPPELTECANHIPAVRDLTDLTDLTHCNHAVVHPIFQRMMARYIRVDGDDKSFEQRCALTCACLQQDEPAVARLVAAGTCLTPECAWGILRSAVLCQNARHVQLLLLAKADAGVLSEREQRKCTKLLTT